MSKAGSKRPRSSLDDNEDLDSRLSPEATHSRTFASRDNVALDLSCSTDLLEEEVCFGSILDVKSQLTLEPWLWPRSFSISTYTSFDVRPVGAYFGLYLSEDLVSVLNKKACEFLSMLKERSHIRLEATGLPPRGGKKSAVMNVDLNMYGASQDSKTAGDVVAEFGITLQRPEFDLESTQTAYRNPHYLEISHSSEADLLDGRETGYFSRSRPYLSRRRPQPVNASEEVSSILDSLSHQGIFRERLVDERIRSQLLPHQKEAIDFIFRRETGDLPPDMRLWDFNKDDERDPYYVHVISGVKKPWPGESKGGILADDMGLGKSLVILSIIAGSFDRATAFLTSHARLLVGDVTNQGRRRSSATLVVVPSSLLIDNWIEEIRKHTLPGALAFFKHHGNKRMENSHQIFQSNIVFTTYATVAAEDRRSARILADISWFRIVLDEAHDIRNSSTDQFKAMNSLVAQHRWCLTGTPIQNSLQDLWSLIMFLKVPGIEDASTFRKCISRPCTSPRPSKQTFQPLRRLLASICLRRTRELINLPEPIQQTRTVELTALERQQYKGILEDSKWIIEMAVSKRGGSKVSTAVLQSLLRLRLFCNNGTIGRDQSAGAGSLPTDPDEILTFLQQRDEALCIYCSGFIYTINDARNADGGVLIKDCMHLVCRGCLPQYHADKRKCSRCASGDENRGLEGTDLMPMIADIPNDPTTEGIYPSKLLHFLQDVQNDRQGYARRKSIAFSAWKKTLDIVGKLLTNRGIKFCYIHGSLSLKERSRVLKDFRSPLGPDLLLMTLGTGAVGLDLALVTKIYLLEPQWNPSIELQAVGRALRVGQKEHVVITRYIMRETIEDSNVLSRQTRKLQLADGGFSQKRQGLSSERIRTISDIFGIDLGASGEPLEEENTGNQFSPEAPHLANERP